MNIVSGFADISLLQLLLVAGVALFASVVGGLAGYGTGALMPLVLVPLIGAEPVVPIIAISAIFTNLSRAAAYFRYADRRRALIVIAAAALTTALGAYGYTRLSNAGAALVIGTMLILSVPLRRLLKRRDVRIGDAGLGAGAVGYGVVVGGTSGSGVILLSLLMAAGLEGAAVIATDAVISVATSVIKISVFGLAGVITAQVLAFALLIGGGGAARGIPGPGVRRAHAGAHPHRDPRTSACADPAGVVMIPRRCGHLEGCAPFFFPPFPLLSSPFLSSSLSSGHAGQDLRPLHLGRQRRQIEFDVTAGLEAETVPRSYRRLNSTYRPRRTNCSSRSSSFHAVRNCAAPVSG